jgi:hypothetical protein
MRTMAGEQRHVTAYQDEKGWHGVELVNHPTPSGECRLLPSYSDKRVWPDRETAIREFEKVLPKVLTEDEIGQFLA